MGGIEFYFLVILKVSKSEIKIKLPDYIENIFHNASIDWEIDHLKSMFDDRNIEKFIYSKINRELYYKLLLAWNFHDPYFLKAKKNLFYLKDTCEQINFHLSEFFDEKNLEIFIKKELEEVNTHFDKYNKYYYLVFNNENKSDKNSYHKLIEKYYFVQLTRYSKKLSIREKFIKNLDVDSKIDISLWYWKNMELFVKTLKLEEELKKWFKDRDKKVLNLFRWSLYKKEWIEFIKELGLVDQLKEWFKERDEKILDLFSFTLSSKEWIEFIKELEIEDELQKWFKERDEKILDLFRWSLNAKEWIEFIKALGLVEELKEWFKERDEKILNLFRWSLVKKGWIEFVKELGLVNQLKEWFKERDEKILDLFSWSLDKKEWIAFIKELELEDELQKWFKERDEKILNLFSLWIYSKEKFLFIKKLKIDKQLKNWLKEWNRYIDNLIYNHSHYMSVQELKDFLNVDKNIIKCDLKDFVKTTDSGSCLLSWYRWTWKSSLLSQVVNDLEKENKDTDIVKVVINIPEQKFDEKGEVKSFQKNELITKIIREIYHSLIKKWFPKKEILHFEEQYVRTFSHIEEINGFLRIRKKWFIRLAIDVLSFSFPIVFWLLINYILWKFNIEILWISFWIWSNAVQLFISLLLIVLSFLIFRTILNVHFNSKIERSLYNDDIAEYKLNENIRSFSIKKWLIDYFVYIKITFTSVYKNLFHFYFWKRNFKIILFWIIIFVLVIILELIFKIITIWICVLYFVWKYIYNNYWNNKKRKFVIIIDELDKLLDFEKASWKHNLNIKDIFDILWKLKTLFFDNTWAVFFVVTNKDAYDYFLEHRHAEDDLISNIFNKVVYLPMNRKENFQFNNTFKIEVWTDKENKEKKEEIENGFMDWLYYKSHWNWRKANFILNQNLESRDIIFNKKEVDYEMKFYNFMNILYDMFFYKTNNKFKKYIKPTWCLSLCVKHLIINKDSDYNDILSELIKWISEDDNKLIYDKINILKDKYLSNESNFTKYSYVFSSVDKISWEEAYRDYIFNNILNVIELLKHDRTINIQDIFHKLKFWKKDFNYPVFEDLLLIWIPFLIYYFDKFENND